MQNEAFPDDSGRNNESNKAVQGNQAPIRVALYTRISTDESNQPYPLEAQREALEAFVASQRILAITHRFSDQHSRTTKDCVGLQDALRAAERGEFDMLLVSRLDRIAQKQSVSLDVISELGRCGVAFRSVTEEIDSTTPTGKMLLELLGTFAKSERDSFTKRIKRGKVERASKGHWPGGRPPFGYRMAADKNTLVIQENEAGLIRRIFCDYVDGRNGAMEIATELNTEGIKTPGGSLWKVASVLSILRRPTYAGYIVYLDHTYDGAFEPIIDRKTFNDAQNLLDDHALVAARKVADSD